MWNGIPFGGTGHRDPDRLDIRYEASENKARTQMNSLEPAVLRAALIGYQHQLDEIDAQIKRIRAMLAGAPAVPYLGGLEAPQQKHHVSAEGRARIAAAQRKRWAAARRAAKAAK